MTKPKETKSEPGVLSEADLLNEFDRNTYIPKKVREAIASLGPDGAMREVDFCRRAGVTALDLASVRDEYFAEHFVLVRDRGDKRRIWFGSKAYADKMRPKIGVAA